MLNITWERVNWKVKVKSRKLYQDCSVETVLVILILTVSKYRLAYLSH